MSIFSTLNNVNVNENVEKKNGLSYLPWAWAWTEVKRYYPNATYTVYKRPDGVNYWTDGRTCWVETGVTIEGLEHIEMLPVMDYKNCAIPLESVTSTDVNKAIQRSLTKAAARHGLGLYIYAGEDLPECEREEGQEPQEPTTAQPMTAQEIGQRKLEAMNAEPETCERCQQQIKPVRRASGKLMSPAEIAENARKTYGGTYCMDCMVALKNARKSNESD